MWRAAGIIAVGLTSVALASGAEKTTATPAAPNAIDAAKRDYDAIKTLKFSQESQQLDLPKTSAPELHLSDPAAGDFNLLSPSAREKEKTKSAAQRRGQKGSNWLVDAMLGDKEKAAKTGSTATLLAEDANSTDTEGTSDLKLTDLAGQKSALTDATPRRGEKADAAETKEPPRVVNPLDGFLAGWMTPGDYQLLKTAPDAGRGPGVSGGAPVSNLTAPIGGAPAPPASEPRVNPYLAESPPSNLEFNAPTMLNPVSGGPAPMPPPAPLMPLPADLQPIAPKSSVTTPASELSKARDDAKYFPQLKRF